MAWSQVDSIKSGFPHYERMNVCLYDINIYLFKVSNNSIGIYQKKQVNNIFFGFKYKIPVFSSKATL